MDLVTAKKEAATRSQATKKDQFVNLKENGDHEVATKAGNQPMLKFSNGVEVKVEVPAKKESKKPESKAPVKAAPDKKVAEKKQPTKKPAKKKEVKQKTNTNMKASDKKSAKKIVNRVAAPKGKTTTMTAKQLRAKVLDGKSVFNTKGSEISCSAMAANDPGKKLNVVVNSKGYFITK